MENADKLIEKLKKSNVKPIPKWYFTTKGILIWAAFALSVILGALAFSVVLFAIQQSDFNLISHMSHSRLELFLGLLPFLWIAFLIIFLVLAIYSIQNSKKGYKFPFSTLTGINIALSVLFGTLFFIIGGAQRFETAFALRVSLYNSIQEKKVKFWGMPEEGLLAGEVLNVRGDTIFLKDFKNKAWNVTYGNAFIPPAVSLSAGETVKMTGSISGKSVFSADEIRPWSGFGNRAQQTGEDPRLSANRKNDRGNAKTRGENTPGSSGLSGEITEISGDTLFLKDPGGNIWLIDLSQAFISRAVSLETGAEIRLTGIPFGENGLKAIQIIPSKRNNISKNKE